MPKKKYAENSEYQKAYRQSGKNKEAVKKYQQSDKGLIKNKYVLNYK